MPIGDLIESALTRVGITHALVEQWIGAPCGCQERKEKLNQLGFWARRVLAGKLDNSKKWLYGIIGESHRE